MATAATVAPGEDRMKKKISRRVGSPKAVVTAVTAAVNRPWSSAGPSVVGVPDGTEGAVRREMATSRPERTIGSLASGFRCDRLAAAPTAGRRTAAVPPNS